MYGLFDRYNLLFVSCVCVCEFAPGISTLFQLPNQVLLLWWNAAKHSFVRQITHALWIDSLFLHRTHYIHLLLILESFDCLASSHRAPRQIRIGERSLNMEGTGEIKNLGRTWKLTYDGLPGIEQDLRRSGNWKWGWALIKLTVGGDEVNRYSYR